MQAPIQKPDQQIIYLLQAGKIMYQYPLVAVMTKVQCNGYQGSVQLCSKLVSVLVNHYKHTVKYDHSSIDAPHS